MNLFSYEWFCTQTRFETEVQGNSEMVYWKQTKFNLNWDETIFLFSNHDLFLKSTKTTRASFTNFE